MAEKRRIGIERLATTSYEDIDERVLSSLHGLRADQLSKVIRIARAQEPPNIAIIAAAGTVAHEESKGRHPNNFFISAYVIEAAFPGYNAEAAIDEYTSRITPSTEDGI